MKKSYTVAIDILRILAILAVLLIHTTTRTLEASKYTISSIPFTFFLNQIAIFAVPLFFLISGFVLELNYRDINYISYLKKRASKILIPYLFWSLFYYFAYPVARIPHTSLEYLLLSGQASYQLYFIPAIILFYICFPFLHTCISFFSKWYVIFLVTLVQCYLLLMDYYFHEIHIESALRVGVLCFALFIFGMVASHHQEEILLFTKKYFSLLLILLLLCIGFTMSETYILLQKTQNLHFLYSQYHPIVFPYTLIIATLILHLFSQIEKYKAKIIITSKLSFFVFFIHVSLIYTFWYTIGSSLFSLTRENMLTKISYDVFFFGLITALSFFIAFLIHKIPYASKLTG